MKPSTFLLYVVSPTASFFARFLISSHEQKRVTANYLNLESLAMLKNRSNLSYCRRLSVDLFPAESSTMQTRINIQYCH